MSFSEHNVVIIHIKNSNNMVRDVRRYVRAFNMKAIIVTYTYKFMCLPMSKHFLNN